MPSVHTLAAFAVACVLLSALPGPTVLYLATRSVSQGSRAGVVAEVGVIAGTTAQVGAAAAGLSALLASSATWFAVVKYLGAAYLVALGIRTLLGTRGAHLEETTRPQTRLGGCWQGFLVTALNPKLAVFMLAFLPQFVEPSHGPTWLQIIVLGTVLNLVGAATDVGYILLAGTLGMRLRRSVRALRASELTSGVVYIALGVFAALTGHRPQAT